MTKMSDEEVEKLLRENPHLREYVERVEKKIGRPAFYSKLSRDLKEEKYPNIIYPTKGVVFIHIYRTKDMEEIEYHAVEPTLNDLEKKKLEDIMEQIYERAPKKGDVKTDDEIKNAVKELLDEIVIVDEKANVRSEEKKGFLSKLKSSKIRVTPVERMDIEYNIVKDIIGGGPLEPFMRDPYIEDVHVITGEKVHLIHKVFEMVKTNIEISEEWASTFSQEFSEKIGSPVSEGQPIADGTLPDGSRVNIIHSKDVSLKGPTMTIRKFSETPISVTQLISWGTISAGIAAYLWLCLQYGRSLFVCGETASGKTTTTNAIIPFIPPNKKIYTAENTPEVKVPHAVWQQLLTKSTGPKESHVELFDLLKAALRSRPDYIIPGETRGIEGRIVDETYHMLIIETSKGEKKIMKKGAKFRIKLNGKEIVINGDDINYRPHERIKKLIRRKGK